MVRYDEVCVGGMCLSPMTGRECDDGNSENADSCDNTCNKTACGDGLLQAGEQCDDKNRINGDGCSTNCKQDDVR